MGIIGPKLPSEIWIKGIALRVAVDPKQKLALLRVTTGIELTVTEAF